MLTKVLKYVLAISLLSAVAQAVPITYILTFNGVATTTFGTPLNSDFVGASATQYLAHFAVPQALNTTESTVQAELNFSSLVNATGNITLNVIQDVTISSLPGGVSVTNGTTQNLAFPMNDAATGAQHVFSVLAPLPSVQFLFNDGTALTVTVTNTPTVTLSTAAGSASSSFNNVTYSVTYAAAVPEPTTLLLAGCGLLGLLATAHRRRG